MKVEEAPAATSSFVAASPHAPSSKRYSTLKKPGMLDKELSIVSVDGFELPLHAPKETDTDGSRFGQSAVIESGVLFGPVVT